MKEQENKCILDPKQVFHPRSDCEVRKATWATWSKRGCVWLGGEHNWQIQEMKTGKTSDELEVGTC